MAKANRKRKVMFSDKQHAKKGVVASALGVIALLVLAGLIGIAYATEGNVNRIAGVIGVFDILLCGIGFVLGVISFKERDRIYVFSGAGTILNGILIFIWISIYIRGFYAV